MGFWHQMGLKMNKKRLKMDQKEYSGLKIVCFNQNTRFFGQNKFFTQKRVTEIGGKTPPAPSEEKL